MRREAATDFARVRTAGSAASPRHWAATVSHSCAAPPRTACTAVCCAQVRERLVNVLGDVCVRVPRPLLTVWLQLAALSAKFNGHPSLGNRRVPPRARWV